MCKFLDVIMSSNGEAYPIHESYHSFSSSIGPNSLGGRSLSMKLRTEAVLPASLRHTTSSIDVSQTLTESLSFSPVKDISKINKTKTFKDKVVLPESRTKNQFDRLSGSYDFMASSGAFPDRFHVTHPTAICLRCAGNADVCMRCTETIADEALTFYRKTRATGAASLFQHAIKEAGLSKSIKFMLFNMWRNGIKQRSKRSALMNPKIAKLYFIKIIVEPFKAWKKFAKESVVERKDKLIAKLEERLDVLEKEMQKVSIVKNHSEGRIKGLEKELATEKKVVEEQKGVIDGLSKELLADRKRVIGLTALTRPLAVLTSSLYDVVVTTNQGVHIEYENLAHKQLVSSNYLSIFDKPTDIKETLVKHMNKNKARAAACGKSYNSEIELESREAMNILMKWFNGVSDEASYILDPHRRKSLDTYLPPNDLVRSLNDLCDGQQLVRVIVVNIYHQWARPGNNGTCEFLSINELNELKSAAGKSATKLIQLALSHAAIYLNIPIFKSGDIESGNPDVLLTLLSTLLLSAAPSRHPDGTTAIKRVISKLDVVNNEINEAGALRDNVIQSVVNLQKVWAGFTGNDVVTSVIPPVEEVEDEDMTEDAEEKQGGSNTNESKSDDQGQVAASEGATSEGAVVANSTPADPMASYHLLAKAVDLFIADESVNPKVLPMATKIGTSVHLVNRLKEKAAKIQQDDYEGACLSSTVKEYLVKNIVKILGKDLKIVREEIE